jgi:regulator of protease activity HflC (stomatin/prohibitin superfamily)
MAKRIEDLRPEDFEKLARRIGFKGFAVIVVILLLLVILPSVVVYVRPFEFGIKEVKIGFKRGIQEEVREPGWVFCLPFGMQHVYRFPSDIQVLELTNYPTRHSSINSRTEKAAKIQTSDGFYVDVDVSILYRIADAYKVITTLGPGSLYVDNGIIPRAEPVLKQALGTLTTEDFYNSPLRYKKVLDAQKLLQAAVEDKGLKIEGVLLRYFEYSPEIQKNIEEKKLKDQLVFKNQAEGRAALEQAKLRKVVEEGEANVAIKLEEGKAYLVTRKSERDLYQRTKYAEGNLLVELAEAHKTDLKNQALQAGGSDRLVGLRMADVLKGLELVMLPSDGEDGFNPLDLDATLRIFDVKR